MKINFDTLKQYGLYDNLPDELKSLRANQYFTFFYTPDYNSSKLIIHKSAVVAVLNVSLYRDIYKVVSGAGTGEVFLGYFSDSFETRDGLFYMLLKTYCTEEAVSAFYAYASENDRQSDFVISNNASVEIHNRDSFSKAIAYFSHPSKINTIMSVYDMVDEHLKAHNNQSLYGDYIKKVVTIAYHEGGVMAEENGLLRFMVVGEKSDLSEEQKQKLDTAKNLLRSLVRPKDIYIQTGWFFNEKDGLWRHNISDYGVSIKRQNIVSYKGMGVYKPAFSTLTENEITGLIGAPANIFIKGYNGVLKDILDHERLFQCYPQLANLPVIYVEGNSNEYEFYYSDSGGSGFMVIYGNPNKHNLLSVLLHETQHAVQRIEGFATGGNQMLASFVVSIGGKDVRRIFSMIHNFQRFIVNNYSNESSFNSLKGAIEGASAESPQSAHVKAELLKNMSTYEVFEKNKKQVGFMLIFFITSSKVFNEGALIELLEQKYGYEIYDLLEMVNEAMESSSGVASKLSEEGYRKEDVQSIMFNAYQDLMGEVESRGTQMQMNIPVNLTNYFYLYDWEKSPTRNIAVIGGNYIVADSKSIVGAIEYCRDDKYIMHFKKSISCVPFIHELGHAVHDILKTRGHGDTLMAQYNIAQTGDSYEEYFVHCFMGYLYQNMNDDNLTKDLRGDMSVKTDEVIDKLLDEVFVTLNQEKTSTEGFLDSLEDSTKN